MCWLSPGWLDFICDMLNCISTVLDLQHYIYWKKCWKPVKYLVILILYLRGACSISFFFFLIQMICYHPRNLGFQISVKSVKPFGYMKIITYIAIAYTLLLSMIMVTITSHIFINIFQTVHREMKKETLFCYQNLRKFGEKTWNNQT